MSFSIQQIANIARVCHEANRAYCHTLGDYTQDVWDLSPAWQKSSAIAGVRFHLKTLGEGKKPLPSDSHNSWLKEKEADGWKYGPVKNPDTKEHPCFVPYEQLPCDQQLKDFIFAAIVEAFYSASHKGNATHGS